MTLTNKINEGGVMQNDNRDMVSIVSIRWILTSLALTMLLPSLATSITNVALPTLAKTFAISFHETQWIVLAYLIPTTSLIVVAGRLGDMINRHQLMLSGTLLFTIASVLCGFAPSFWVLIVGRIGQGIGATVLMALTIAYVGDVIPKSKTGSAMGLLGTMSAIGTASGPSIGGVLISAFGWRSIFFVLVLLGIFSMFLTRRYLPTPKEQLKTTKQNFDIIGTLLLALSIGAYALAVNVKNGQFSQSNLILLLVAMVGSVLFVTVEMQVKTPLIQLKLLRNPILSARLIINVLVMTVMMATLVVTPFYLSIAIGLDESLVGLVMSIGPAISIVTGFPAGRMVDRFGVSSISMIGLVAMAIGAFALSSLPMTLGVLGYVIAIVILTPSYQLFQAANNTGVMMGIHPNQRGVISGILSLSRNLGLITGTSVMGAIFASASMTTDITSAQPSAIATGMSATFMVAGILMVIALGITIVGEFFKQSGH